LERETIGEKELKEEKDGWREGTEGKNGKEKNVFQK
jgi:hypothetical protein